jgi:geranylgeranyl diphosphate synthase type I
VLALLAAFDRMTIDIVSGQVLDLSFERRRDVAPAEYLQMIAGKTAAIVQYAAWAGALLGGADEETAARWGEFGLALGLGFQVQDDLLGVWGATAATGKAEADDIRRKKQSLPIILLQAAASPADRAALDRVYGADEIDAAGVRRVLELLERYEIRASVERQVRAYHADAARAIDIACPDRANAARRALVDKVELLASRSH